MIRVVLADDHPALRAGLRVLLEQAPDIEVVGEAETGQEALSLVEQTLPDVVVLDCQLPQLDGITVAGRIREQGLPTRVLALSAYDDKRFVRGMVEAGAVGYLLKNEAPEVIVSAVRAAEMESWFSPSVTRHVLAIMREEAGVAPPVEGALTEREEEVLRAMARGWTNSRIAEALHISERTVAYHIVNVLGKLGAENRTEAVVEAIRRGLIEV